MTPRILLSALAVLSISILAHPAEAAKRSKPAAARAPLVDVAAIPAYPMAGQAAQRTTVARSQPARHSRHGRAEINSEIVITGGRSAACRVDGNLTCGCETALYFGVRNNLYPNGKHDLDLASNWRFLEQSSVPCAGCAAWRNGHVMAIKSIDANGNLMVMNPNSGHGLTREYKVSSLPGYHFAIPADLSLRGRHVTILRSPHRSRHAARRHHRHSRFASR